MCTFVRLNWDNQIWRCEWLYAFCMVFHAIWIFSPGVFESHPESLATRVRQNAFSRILYTSRHVNHTENTPRTVEYHENHVRWIYLTTVLYMGVGQKNVRSMTDIPCKACWNTWCIDLYSSALPHNHIFSHAAMIKQRYEQFWFKPIPHDFEKLILNQWSLNYRKWLNLC